MKLIWTHIIECKKPLCEVVHCIPSRSILSHFSKCQFASCPICGPVRDAIKKNYARKIANDKKLAEAAQSLVGLADAVVCVAIEVKRKRVHFDV
jgi:E1A/CREB-binding protein